ncbi:MAG: hypothetical protein IJA85_06885 [Clostridia bacterium]|nr:hypothetical protein [Clostridia bacterium]MBQ4574911.1 hypothetical protein [Clostridia bacterium]
MTEQIIIAVITVVGTMASSFAGIIISGKLTEYRLTQLEKKVEKLASLGERVTVVEQKLASGRTYRSRRTYDNSGEGEQCRITF